MNQLDDPMKELREDAGNCFSHIFNVDELLTPLVGEKTESYVRNLVPIDGKTDGVRLLNEMLYYLTLMPTLPSKDQMQTVATRLAAFSADFSLLEKADIASDVLFNMSDYIDTRFENALEFQTILIREFALPTMQNVYAQFLSITQECSLNTEAKQQRDTIAARMKKGIDTAKFIIVEQPTRASKRQ